MSIVPLLPFDNGVSYNFTAMDRLPSNITFTRASSGTRFNSSGSLETLGTDVARFDTNPVTLQPRGLRLEGARTNLLLNSATLSTQNVTVAATTYTISFYGTGSITLSGTATGTLNGAGAFPNRAQLTFTPTAGTLTVTVTGSVLNAQLEVGGRASSWIPTGGTSATRALDTANILDLSTIGLSAGVRASGYSVVAEVEVDDWVSGLASGAFQLNDNTNNNRVQVGRGSASAITQLFVATGGVTQVAANSVASFPTGTVLKMGFSLAPNDAYFSVNGATPVTDTSATLPTVDRAFIGRFVGINSELFGWLRRLTVYPTSVGAQIQGLTA